jgi:4-amino-4-deoxy-L-arabinose transferase-like glycosyltransferase
MFHRRVFRSHWAVVVLGVLVRVAVMLRGPGAFDDPDNYLPLARSLAAGEGFTWKGRPTAYRPPLYPVLLAPSVAILHNHFVWGVALLHLGLGAGTVWLTAIAARGSGLSPARCTIAALVTACDPVLVWQSRMVMTETPTAFFLAAALAALACRRWLGPVLGGIGLGMAALCRPSMLAGAVLTVLATILAPPGKPRQRLMRGGLLAVTILVVLSPWTVRNVMVFGEPVWTTTHGGYTLALANNSVYYDDVLHGAPGRVWTGQDQWLWWDAANRATAGMSEPQADRYMRRTVWQLVRERPGDFGRAVLARLGHFWSVAPAAAVYSRGIRAITTAWTLPLWLAVLLALPRRELWSWPRIAAPLAAIGLTLVHGFYWTDLRMRAPIVPAIALVAAGAALPRFIFMAKRASATVKPASSDQGTLVG